MEIDFFFFFFFENGKNFILQTKCWMIRFPRQEHLWGIYNPTNANQINSLNQLKVEGR